MLRYVLALTVVVLLPSFAEKAGAAIQNGDQIIIDRVNHNTAGVWSDGNYDTLATWGGAGGGGEFRVREITGPGPTFGEIFKTFCLEQNENITLGSTYYATLDAGAIQGGDSGGNPDPLSDATKWLYYWFVQNTLDMPDLDPGAGVVKYRYDNQTDASELQEAIWKLEGEISSTDGLATKLVNYATTQGAFNVSNAEVLVLNLWSAYPVTNEGTQRRQSQLYFRTTEGGNQIPEPASMAIWGLMALGGVVAWRRRAA